MCILKRKQYLILNVLSSNVISRYLQGIKKISSCKQLLIKFQIVVLKLFCKTYIYCFAITYIYQGNDALKCIPYMYITMNLVNFVL